MDINILREKAIKAFKYGDIKLARTIQQKIYQHPDRTIDDGKALALFIINDSDFEGGAKILKDIDQAFSGHGDPEIPENIALCEMRCNRAEVAIPYFQKAREQRPTKVNIHDGLCEAFARTGNIEQAVHHSSQSLTLKDKQADGNAAVDLSMRPIPPFNTKEPSKNIISFSLWSNDETYTKGAVRNAQKARELYPHWTCRFYVDETVPQSILAELHGLNGQIIMMEKASHPNIPYFWRFFVCNDADVERYIIRDADSVINEREVAAVEDWLQSGRHFHAMRDFITHSELILAGLWGGIVGALPPLMPLIKPFIMSNPPNPTLDQQFLRQHVWPTFRTSCLIHDSINRLENTVDFPEGSDLLKGQHVGMRGPI